MHPRELRCIRILPITRVPGKTNAREINNKKLVITLSGLTRFYVTLYGSEKYIDTMWGISDLSSR